MAFTFNDSLATDRDVIRSNIGDDIENKGPRPFNGSDRNFSDAYIAAILASEGNTTAATAKLFEVLTAQWASNKTVEREGEASRDAKEVADYYEKQANIWRAKPDGGGGGSDTITAGVIGLDIAARGDDWPDNGS